MKFDLSETHLHYIGLFGGLGLLMLFAFGGWHLSESSEWFRNIWELAYKNGIRLGVVT